MSASNGVITRTPTSGRLWLFQLMSSSVDLSYTSYPSGLWRLGIMGYSAIAINPLNCLFVRSWRVRLFCRSKKLPPYSWYRKSLVKMLWNAPIVVRTKSVGIWASETLRQLPLKLHNSKNHARFGEGEAMSFFMHFNNFWHFFIRRYYFRTLNILFLWRVRKIETP